MGLGMRQDNVYVLGHWEVTDTMGNVQAPEPMGESQLVSQGYPLGPIL